MLRAASVALLAVVLSCTPSPRTAPAPATRFDVVIANGRIVDGTGNAWFHGDVGIAGDRITYVGPAGTLARGTAREFVDARGLAVSPGFIDIQSHSWNQLLWRDGRVLSKVTQGVTTEILGEGNTPAPVNDEMLAFPGPPGSRPARRA